PYSYAYFGDATQPSYDIDSLQQYMRINTIGMIPYCSYRPPQVAIDIAQRNFTTPVEMHNAKPFYHLDNNNYAYWRGNSPESRRFEFETLFLEKNYTLSSLATYRPDGQNVGCFSEQSVWRLGVKGTNVGALQIFGNVGTTDLLSGRHPKEEIGQYRNVMMRLVKDASPVWVCFPERVNCTFDGSIAFADCGNGVYVACIPFNSTGNSSETYPRDEDYDRFMWTFAAGQLGAVIMEVGTQEEHGSYADFINSIKTGTTLYSPATDRVEYISTSGKSLKMEFMPLTTYTYQDKESSPQVITEAGVVPKVWCDGKLVDYSKWKTYHVISGEPIVEQEWESGVMTAQANGQGLQIIVDTATADVTYRHFSTDALRIMPIGSSSSHAEELQNTYRYHLYTMLQSGGYDFDFVGSHDTLHLSPTPIDSLPDPDHECRWHRRADQFLPHIGDRARAAQPDVALIHLGFVDLLADQNDVDNTVAEIGAIIDSLRSVNPTIAVLLAQIIPMPAPYDPTLLNTHIASLASSKSTAHSPVTLVDQYSDMIHPDDYAPCGSVTNPSGAQKMATRWYNALTSIFTETIPRIAVTAPSQGDIIMPGVDIPVAAKVFSRNDIAKVEFYLDSVKLGEDTEAPYQWIISDLTAGAYTVTAKAIDVNLNEGMSETIPFEVGNLPPGITITSPLDRSWYTAPADVTITIDAFDTDGFVSEVDLYEDGSLLAHMSGEPYSFAWNASTPGAYAFFGTATDNEGRTTLSDTTRIKVYEPGIRPFLEIGGVCIVEAENFSYHNIRGDDARWASTADADCANGTCMLAENSSTGNGTNDTGCEMVYEIQITTPGYYFLSARRNAPSSNDDSALLGIDGSPFGGRIIEWQSSGWQWCQSYSIGYLSKGAHSIHIRRREDGLAIDRIMIAQNIADLPLQGATEIGGAESPYAGGADPVAHAGDDRAVDIGAVVTLDGSLSIDPEPGPQPLGYFWRQIGGPTATLSDTNALQPTFTASQHGSYVFELEVSDGTTSSTDKVTVNVRVTVTPGSESADFVVPTLSTSYYILWADSSQNATYMATGNNGTVNRSYNTITLDNGYIEVDISPDLGMRILRAVDKSVLPHREMFAEYSNPANPAPFAQNFGGIKPSFPYVENSTGMIDINGELAYKAGYYIENKADGSVDVVMNMRFEQHQNEEDAGFLGKYGDKNLTCIVTLEPGHSDFKVKYVAENPNPLRRNDRIWTNACYPNVYDAGGQWLFPTKWAVGHFAEITWDIENEGPLDNPAEPLEQYGSYFALNPEYPFAGTWYPASDANHIRVTDPVKYPGAKIYNHSNNQPPYELWGSTNNIFEAPEDFVNSFETNDLEHRYYLARDIGVAEYANEHIAVGIDAGTFKLTAPYDNVITIYDYNQSTAPILENQLVGPGIILTGSFSQGLRIVTDEGVELCNVQLPLVFQDNSSDYDSILASAQQSDLEYYQILDASHGLNYELEDVPGKTRVVSSLASILSVDNITSADNPDILVSMANTAYRHGAFDVVARYIDSIGTRRLQATNYLQALMDLETTGSGDFSNTPIEGNYFKALQHIRSGNPGLAIPLLDSLVTQKPRAIRPRLLRAYLNNDINDALAVVNINPGSIETWTVLNELGYAGAADKLNGLLNQNEHAAYRMNDFLDEIQNGNWRHERRFEYINTWWENIATTMPEFPANLRYVPSGVNQPPTVSLTSPTSYDHFGENSDINITATADDIDGSVSAVEFYEGATLLGSDNTEPYSFTMTSVPSGSYTLTAVAIDNQNDSAGSEPVYITVGTIQSGLFEEQFGVCVMEAEHAQRVDQRTDVTNWVGSTVVGEFAGDGYMEVLDGTGGGTNTWDSNCELAYDVYISMPGTYRIAVRYRAPDGTSNSAKYGIDGVVANESDFWEMGTTWRWFHGANPLGYLDAGPHTVQIRRREDGWQVDRVMIAINATDFPAHLSDVEGPAESPLTRGANELPVVSLSSPADGSTFKEPADITITADASDTDGSVTVVEFYHGVTKIGEDATAPYEYAWNSIAAGNYSLTAKAIDNSGGDSISVAVTISVVENQPPALSLTSPAEGASFDEGADVVITTDASDTDGSISLVEFFQGAVKLGEDLTAPYEYIWKSPPEGVYSLTAVATDNDGAATTSGAVNISVVANQPPTATITAPSDGASFTLGTNIIITADATDNDGSITLVEFFQGGTKLGDDTTAPYEYTWVSPPLGAYSITAVATDDKGATTASSPISISVNETAITGPKLAGGLVDSVGESWITIPLPYSYDSMVVVCTPVYDNSHAPAVVRVRNAVDNSFDIRMMPVGGPGGSSIDVYYLVAETGVYTEASDGITMEAVKVTSTRTDYKGSWVGRQMSYGQSYSSPVVVGQVMSYNDGRWSVFWCRGSSSGNPPSTTDLFVGKMVGEDPDRTRSDETIGYIVFESGAWNQTGISINASLGADILQGMTNTPPYTYSHSMTTTNGAVVSQAAMDGGDGAWAVLYGNNPVSSSSIEIGLDEDILNDTERGHTTEQAGYVVFESAPANILPLVSITVPSAGAAYKETADILITADATDEDGTISMVEFFEGATRIGEDNTAPFEIIWSGHPLGDYSLTAVAVDNSGGTATSEPVPVSIVDNLPPEVSLTSPAGGAEFDEGTDIVIAATASDIDGSIDRVAFFDGADKLGEDFSAPYEFTLSSVLPDVFEITALAFDNEGDSAISDTVTITIHSTDPRLTGGIVTSVESAWQTVTLPNTYTSMVVVCTPVYDAGHKPSIVRIRNAVADSFDVRVDATDGGTVSPVDVYYFVAEEGVYNSAEHGVTMEARTMLSTSTDENNSWVGKTISYSQGYTNPVVVGQVMTCNDSRFSVFWSRGNSVTDPPSSSSISIGKTVCEDDIVTRNNETLGYIVLESGSYSLDDITIETALGNDVIFGIADSPPYSYSHGVANPAGAVTVLSGMDGNNGGWAVLYGSNPVTSTSINLAIDEDQESDIERNHTSEQVGYVVFEINRTNEPPTVGISSPTGGASFDEGQDVIIAADASDTDGAIAQVEFFIDTTSLGIDTTVPYQLQWFSPASGAYALTAVATDNDGDSAISAPINITVVANQPPAIELTSPHDNTSFKEGSDVSLNAAALDTDGAIAQVEFFIDTLSLGIDTIAPYELTWTSPAIGSYSLSATATDDDEATTTSPGITITILANQPPIVDLTAPSDSVSVIHGNDITLTATAIDSDGAISAVEFFQGAQSLGIDTISPYEFTWVSPPTGTYELTALATDNDNATTVSSIVTVSIVANQLPTADAGRQMTVLDSDLNGSETVMLDGSGSRDNDGSIQSYRWENAGVEIANGINPAVNLSAGIHILTLIVTDDLGGSDSDKVAVTVSDRLDENIEFPSDAGVIDVTLPPYNAVPDGETDVTAAINQALADYPNGNRIIYLPNGIYHISDTLRWPLGADESTREKRTILQGQCSEYTIIRLRDNCPPYADTAAPRPVLFTGTKPAQRFRNSIRNLTVNIGSGNPGAEGIQYNASNQGSIRSVKIISEDGRGRIGLNLSFTSEIGPCLIKDVLIDGFDRGVETGCPVNSQVFENLTLQNQNQYGFVNFQQCVSIKGLTSFNEVPVLWNRNTMGHVVLIDAQLTGTGAASTLPAIINDETFFGRNITVDGYALSIDNNNGTTPDAVENVVSEYVSHEVSTLFDGAAQSLNLPMKETPTVPWDSLSEWANPVAYGADSTGATDATAAIQQAIDAGHTTIYFPNGTFRVDDAVYIRNEVRRLIGCEGRFVGSGKFIVDSGTAPVVVFERFYCIGTDLQIEHASSRALVLSSCMLPTFIAVDAGEVYMEDVYASPVRVTNTNLWARQLNSEVDYTKIVNDGGNLWILGLKTERKGALIDTRNGGSTELLGGFCYSTGSDPKTMPMFINHESEFSASIGEIVWGDNTCFDTLVKETHNGITRKLLKDDVPARDSASVIPLYVGTPPDSPIVDFSADQTSGFAPHTVIFSATIRGGPVDTLKWDFSDGTTDTGSVVSHTYTANGLYTVSLTAVGAGGTVIESKTDYITVHTNSAPTVTIMYPGDGAVFNDPSNITITADASDNDGVVGCVEFYEGANKLGEDTIAPFEFTWISPDQGSYSLTAVAIDDDNAKTTSDAVSITVGTNVLPEVTIITPIDNSFTTPRNNLTIGADAFDGDGSVEKVEFFANGISLGADNTSPYEIVWHKIPMGVHSLAAVATDNTGGSSESVPVTVTAEWRIMPIGNSITEGNGGDPTYRYFLWQDLVTNGYNVNLVGTNYGTKDGPSSYDFDQDHQGTWGIKSDEALQLIGDQAGATTPDMVLIHLGTNDIGHDNDIAGMTAEQCAHNTSLELMDIIDALRSVNPEVVVFLAQIIPAYFDSWVVVLNDSIAKYGAEKSTAQSPVVVVDQHSALTYMDDYADGLHPNQSGQEKMGHTWFAAIQEYFALEPRIVPAGGTFTDSVTVSVTGSTPD
ncbi:MAG: DUF5107 domain-containing protein, partial [Chitinivibrionales bacterium]|nr:DUF5107 domain-containing protein [Chitinivibrionales bacterium]